MNHHIIMKQAAIAMLLVVFTTTTAPLCLAAGRTNLPPILPPYLQNPAADGMTVCLMAQNAEQVRVTWGTNGQSTLNELGAQGTRIPGTPWTIWKARLSQLHPGAPCRYQVRYQQQGVQVTTPEYQFRTLDPGAESVRFIQLNDIHNKSDILEGLMRHVRPEDYEFSLLIGDMWVDPDSARQADKVFRTLASYIPLLNASEKPFLLIRGNHETRNTFSTNLAYLFDLPALKPTAGFTDQNWNFAMTAGPVWFVAMDGGDDFIKRLELFQGMRERQRDWLKDLMARKEGSNAAWRILLTHMPLYNTNTWNSEPCRQLWEPVLKDARIDVELSGHDHNWKRIEKGITSTIQFGNGKPGEQDPQHRKSFTLTPLFPVLIGGGPSWKDANIALVTASRTNLLIRHVAATNGLVRMEYKESKPATP
jgi:hypothetical protein